MVEHRDTSYEQASMAEHLDTGVEKIAASTILTAMSRLFVPTSTLLLGLLMWVALDIVNEQRDTTSAINDFKVTRVEDQNKVAAALAEAQLAGAQALAGTTLALAKIQSAVELQSSRLDEISRRLSKIEDNKDGISIPRSPFDRAPSDL